MLKNNWQVLVGAGLLLYAAFLFMTVGVSLKLILAVGVGVFFLLQKFAPAVANKIKQSVKDMAKEAVDEGGKLLDKVNEEPKKAVMQAENNPVVVPDVDVAEHRKYFLDSDQDAIAHLAYEARVNKNDTALQQLKAVDGEFFNIAIKRLDDDLNKESTDEEKPAV